MINLRVVSPGIETHPLKDEVPDAGLWARVDWLRFTAPDDDLERVVRLIEARHGEPDRKTHGARYFRSGLEWTPGVQVSFDHRASICMIDVRGERLSTMTAEEGLSLASALTGVGMKPARVDLALDFIQQDVRLYEQALASCERGELCQLRTFNPNGKKRSNRFEVRRHLALGERGSAVCARIYDKGLEQGHPLSGWWERIEAEFKEDRAPVALHDLLAAGTRWPDVLAGLVVGAFDFRGENGRGEMERRPRVRWWADLLAGLEPRPTKPAPAPKTFEKWVNALRQSYGGRIVQLAEAAGISVGEFCEWVLAGVAPAANQGPLARECVDQRGRQGFGAT